MTRLYVVRHINTKGNSDGIFQGRIDTDPSEIGKEQLLRLRERFRGKKLDVIYASPLGRTLKTAEAVNFYNNAPIIKNPAFLEIDGGKFEGMSFLEIKEQYPEHLKYIDNEVHKFKAVGGESILDVYNRTTPALREVVKLNRGKRIAVVSHALAIKSMLTGILNYPFENMEQRIPFVKNASVTRIDFDEDLTPTLTYLSDTDFLGEDK